MSFERLITRSEEHIADLSLLEPREERVSKPESAHENEARDLCQSGDYGRILETFSLPENEDRLREQTARLRHEYADRLRAASTHLEEHDWEMLTILELFDKETFEHCLRTYETAHHKIHSLGPVGEYLRKHIDTEGLSPWDIELACLLHDMGKIALVPKNLILNNLLADREWHALFESFCHGSLSPEEAGTKIRAYDERLATNPGLREKDITPLAVCLTEEERATLEAAGIDTDLPLGKLIEKHQDISVDIVERYYDKPELLGLIGNHHERPLATDERTPVSQSAVRLSSVIDALRIADIYDAYHSSRPYNPAGHPTLSTLAFLIDKAEDGFVDTELTRLWIQDDIRRFDAKAYLHQLKGHGNGLFAVETDAWHRIQSFLSPESLRQAA